MTLDIVTLYVVSMVVITIVTAAFVLEVASRGRSPVDLIWTLAFTGAIGTAVCYLVAGASDTLWWFVALGNAASVVTTFAMWNGIRADDGRRPLLGVTGAVAAATALAALLPGPGAGEWAGGWALLLGTAAGAGLGGVAGLRGRLRHHRLGGLLVTVLLAVALYYAVRAVLLFTAGPESPVFTHYVGTGTTTLVVLALVTAAGFAMIVIRTDAAHARRAERFGFDPSTGLRSPVTFEPGARELVRSAELSGEPVAFVCVALEGRELLTTAFHEEAAREAFALVVDAVRMLAPPGAWLAGRRDGDEGTFEVVIRGFAGAQAHAWAEALRRRVVATPLEVDETRLRLRVSLGIAGDTDSGHDLAALRATARRRLERALAQGGNRVLSWF